MANEDGNLPDATPSLTPDEIIALVGEDKNLEVTLCDKVFSNTRNTKDGKRTYTQYGIPVRLPNKDKRILWQYESGAKKITKAVKGRELTDYLNSRIVICTEDATDKQGNPIFRKDKETGKDTEIQAKNILIVSVKPPQSKLA